MRDPARFAAALAGEVAGDTIAAPSSPPGVSARAVVRLSGPDAHALAAAVFAPLPTRGGRVAAGLLRLPGWPSAPAEAALFRGPRSYTGEDLVELWVPGAPPLVRRLLATLVEAGARLADRGELTRRAFLRGRLDLTQAEAVLALTTSEDALQARAALRALSGGARGPVDTAKHALVGVLAHLEAAIDFSEEELDLAAPADLAARVEAADAALEALQRACARRAGPAAAPVVALRGPANAGKSSLFNRLTRGAALVSDVAGTTRDVLAGSWNVPGLGAVRLLDTAGVKEPVSAVEAQALAAARAAADAADLTLVVVDARDPAGAAPFVSEPAAATHGPAPTRAVVVALNKLDLVPGAGAAPGAPASVLVSARTEDGLDRLAAAVARALGASGAASELLGTARQDELLRAARDALSRARAQLGGRDPARAELAAADLGEALDALGRLTGEVTTDDVLDRLFASFCVGK